MAEISTLGMSVAEDKKRGIEIVHEEEKYELCFYNNGTFGITPQATDKHSTFLAPIHRTLTSIHAAQWVPKMAFAIQKIM